MSIDEVERARPVGWPDPPDPDPVECGRCKKSREIADTVEASEDIFLCLQCLSEHWAWDNDTGEFYREIQI